VDDSSNRMQAKIRDAQMQKAPFMLVVGDKEAAAQAVAVRSREDGDLGPKPLQEFIGLALAKVAKRS
jgi:threonyl-tRNA synthetase